MHRINTTNPALSGDEVIAHVMARRSTHLPSVQAVTKVLPLTRRLGTQYTLTDANKIVPTADFRV